MARSKQFIVAGINNLLKRNYSIDTDTIDVWALVDSTLTFQENWTIVKEYMLSNKEIYHPLRCKGCNYLIKGLWKYCPECGNKLEGGVE